MTTTVSFSAASSVWFCGGVWKRDDPVWVCGGGEEAPRTKPPPRQQPPVVIDFDRFRAAAAPTEVGEAPIIPAATPAEVKQLEEQIIKIFGRGGEEAVS